MLSLVTGRRAAVPVGKNEPYQRIELLPARDFGDLAQALGVPFLRLAFGYAGSSALAKPCKAGAMTLGTPAARKFTPRAW